jgi:hypothetical protein
MDARRSPETENPAPAAKRPTTDASRAASVCNKLDKLDAEEQAEIAALPADIRAKFEDRRTKVLEGAPEAVRALVGRMRATT